MTIIIQLQGHMDTKGDLDGAKDVSPTHVECEVDHNVNHREHTTQTDSDSCWVASQQPAETCNLTSNQSFYPITSTARLAL